MKRTTILRVADEALTLAGYFAVAVSLAALATVAQWVWLAMVAANG